MPVYLSVTQLFMSKSLVFVPFIILLTVSYCSAQEQLAKEGQPINNPFYSTLDSSNVEYQIYHKLFSPDSTYIVLTRSVGIYDASTKSQYWLIRKEQSDTTEIMTTFRHDLPHPSFFWIDNYLVYQYDQGYNQNPKIVMRNLESNKIDFSIPGSIPVKAGQAHHFYDKINGMLIFYKSDIGLKEPNLDLMILDLKKKVVKKLVSLNAYVMYDYPIVSLERKVRKLSVRVRDEKTGKTKKHQLNY